MSSSSFYGSAVARPSQRLAETTVVFADDAAADAADDAPLLRVFASAQAAAAAADPSAQLAADLGFRARPGEVVFVPGALFLGLGATRAERINAFAAASSKATSGLPAGRPRDVVWRLHDGEPRASNELLEDAALGWRLGSYAFDRFKTTTAAAAEAEKTRPPARLVVVFAPPDGAAAAAASAASAASATAAASAAAPAVDCALTLGALYCWARDLTNAPASDLGPSELAGEAAALAEAHAPAARLSLVRGDDLLARGWPLVHAVGRASAPSRAPVLVDLCWQPPADANANANSNAKIANAADPLPLLVLCGKGVCFDTGGLSLKTSAGMRLMKKDMGGGALVLALAALVMSAALPVRLRVLVPCVENSVGGDANRLGDVLHSRLGLTVEQLNTDAEGRLVLADALAEACGPDCAAPFGEGGSDGFRQEAAEEETEEDRQRRWWAGGGREGTAPSSSSPSSAPARPDLVIDVATLTGAARVALGPELPAVFSNDEAAWRALEAAALREGDPLWRLPLHAPYDRMLASKVADLSNVAAGDAAGQAGAVVAALFLQRFVRGAAELRQRGGAGSPPWLHVDTAGWLFAGSAGPGRPEGGEPLALRALWRMLRERYGGGGGGESESSKGGD